MTFHEKILELKKERKNFVTVTVVNVQGSFPQKVGAKAIFSDNELLFGTVGGGKVENHCFLHAKKMLIDKKTSSFKKWNLQKDIGMTCGGVGEFFFEMYSFKGTFSVTIFGAGHVSQKLCRLLLELDCNITCIDNRNEWLDRLPQSSKLTTIYLEKMEDYIDKIDDNSYVISMTKGHSTDTPILFNALKLKKFPYLGVIGSKSKRNTIIDELTDLGIDKERADSIICPIGLKFGNNTPTEISFSIIAELLKYRDRGTPAGS